MTIHVFIDGAAGTTGLDIADRLAARRDIALIALDEAARKDPKARAEALRDADIAILCLPDDAAREAVDLANGSKVRLIDASSAHRTAPDWTYGLPEPFPGQAERVAAAARVSNPGCYATGFVALIAPLVAAGLLPPDLPLSVNAVSGYSGGGKALIARFDADPALAWRGYALDLHHKHVPEMQRHSALTHPPLFTPAVVPAVRGMVVQVPLSRALHPGIGEAAAMRDALAQRYEGSPIVQVGVAHDGEVLLRRDAAASDRLFVDVFASPDGAQINLVATLDNLGKGAGGACVQNLNLMAGLPETEGLRLG